MTITLFIPCFVDALFPSAGISMVQILERLGHTVVYPEDIACCGQPPFNSGHWDEAREVAARHPDPVRLAPRGDVGDEVLATQREALVGAGEREMDAAIEQRPRLAEDPRVLDGVAPHHHAGAPGEAFTWFAFIFRWMAGVYFSWVFVTRGFGIAVGTHAAYDILVGWLGWHF